MKKDIKQPLLSESADRKRERNAPDDNVVKNAKNVLLKDQVTELPDDTYSTNEIDFKEMLIQHKNRTEKNMPFTLQVVEDVIYTDDRHLIALEYIFYQKDGNYFSLKPESKAGSRDEKTAKPLGTENYDFKQKNNHIKAFRNVPVNYEINKNISYLKEKQKILIETDYEGDNVVVEALLCLYRVTPTGQIEQDKQISFTYDQKFH